MHKSSSKTNDLLATVLSDLAVVVSRVGPERLGDPTPCTAWDVETLRHHILGWLTTFAAGFADPQGRAPSADIGGYRAPADAAGEVQLAADRLLGAIRAGAAERPLQIGENAMPGELALGMILWEYQVHGWDLARASGQLWSPPTAALQESLQFAPAMLTEDYQGDGKPFARRVEVALDAPPLDRLLGLSGREPAWTAPPG